MTDEDIIKWLKSQCNRYVNGSCTSLACLRRGGSKKPTCLAHETLTLIEIQRLCLAVAEFKLGQPWAEQVTPL